MDGLGLNITVMSYNGSIDIGIVADRDVMPDVGSMTGWLADELDALDIPVFPERPAAAPVRPRRRRCTRHRHQPAGIAVDLVAGSVLMNRSGRARSRRQRRVPLPRRARGGRERDRADRPARPPRGRRFLRPGGTARCRWHGAAGPRNRRSRSSRSSPRAVSPPPSCGSSTMAPSAPLRPRRRCFATRGSRACAAAPSAPASPSPGSAGQDRRSSPRRRTAMAGASPGSRPG